MERPLKIVHLIYSLEVGGMETMLVDIANTQAAAGHSVEVVVVNDLYSPALQRTFSPEVRVTMLRRKPGAAPLWLMARLNALMALRRPDVIHAHHPKFWRLLPPWHSRMLVTIHDIRTPLEHCRGGHLVAITGAVADDIMAREPAQNIEVIYNGIRTADIRRRGDRAAGTPLRLIQLGRLVHEKKGQDVLVRALAEAVAAGTDATVDFIGDGPSRQYLENLAAELGVSDRVHFLGLRDRAYIYDHLADYDAMVHPSVYEGFGLIVAEAMAAGLPLILTEYDGPWEVAARGQLCLSATRGDASSFAAAIADLAVHYPAALTRAARALEYVEGYDIRGTASAYITYYRHLLSN